MPKKIFIGESDLLKIKNAMAGNNISHSNSIVESTELDKEDIDYILKNKPNRFARWAVADKHHVQYFEKKSCAIEGKRSLNRLGCKTIIIDLDKYNITENDVPPYEADEFEIGGEGGNNDFFHIEKSKLDEHHRDQRLPFEEPKFSRKRYIEQYVDWLEEFGRYGELPPSTLDFWEEIKKAIKEVKEKGLNGRFDSNFPLHKTNEEIFNELKNEIIGPELRFQDGKVVVERQIRITEDPSWYNNGVGQLNDDLYNKLIRDYNDNVGGCWSYREGGGNSYCAYYNDDNYILLCGLIRTDDIDFIKTVQLNYHYPDEHEIRVKPFAKIELEEVHYSVNGQFGKRKTFNKHLIVNATYSGNKAKYHGEFGTIDDGFGNVTLIDRNRNVFNIENLSDFLAERLKDNKFLCNVLGGSEFWVDSFHIDKTIFCIYVSLFNENKYNFYDIATRNFLSDEWFDKIVAEKNPTTHNFEFYNGVVEVVKKGKYNFFNVFEKRLLSDEWFEFVEEPNETGIVVVKHEDSSFDFLNIFEGKMLTDFRFYMVRSFKSKEALSMFGGNATLAYATGKTYIVNKNGNVEAKDEIITANENTNKLKENIESEVESSEVKLDSFKKRDTLAPKIWDGFDLNPKVRLKLLDIADDFWEFVNLNWVKRKGIYLTGSICNFNWSKHSDIDMHIVVDFSDVDEREDFVQDYFNSKKDEWNTEHSKLKIYGFQVELYVENVNAETESGGIYDLEDNSWVKKPNSDNIKPIGLDKYTIKDKSAELMTKVDDLYDKFKVTDDDAKLRAIGNEASDILDGIKKMRKVGLKRGGESDQFNIVYKVLRRAGYIDKLWNLKSSLYDKLNSITEINEGVLLEYLENWVLNNLPQYRNQIMFGKNGRSLKEEVVADGNASHNPFKQKWKHEREVLKNYLVNYGEIMTSKENGKEYKVLYDTMLSSRLGISYCICIQWNSMEMRPGNVIYVRAFDKFTRRRFKPQFDTRGFDNIEGTSDDVKL